MTVQYSIQKMVSDGTLSTIALGIQYLQRNDIYIRIAGEATPQSGAPSGYTWSFINNTTLKILPVVPNGVEVVVYRRTDVDTMYNIYSQNAQFDEATIDENNQQLLYIAQEYLEQGIPGAGVDTIEFIRDDGTYSYYRIKRTDGSYSDEFAVPSASNATRVFTREIAKRSYADAGLNLVVGSFQVGFTLVNTIDVVLDEVSGKAFSGPAGTYPAGTDSTAPGFTDKSGVLLRNTMTVDLLQFQADLLYAPATAGHRLTNAVYTTDAPFLAKCNGVDDDAQAIRDAIDYAVSVGKQCVQPGVSYIGSQIIAKGTLIGLGSGVSGFVSNATMYALKTSFNPATKRIAGLSVKSTATTQETCNLRGLDTTGETPHFTVIEDLYFGHLLQAIKIDSNFYSNTFRGIVVYKCGTPTEWAIEYVDSGRIDGANNTLWDGLSITSDSTWISRGLKVSDAWDVTFNHLHLEHLGDYAAELGGRGVTIIGGYIEHHDTLGTGAFTSNKVKITTSSVTFVGVAVNAKIESGALGAGGSYRGCVFIDGGFVPAGAALYDSPITGGRATIVLPNYDLSGLVKISRGQPLNIPFTSKNGTLKVSGNFSSVAQQVWAEGSLGELRYNGGNIALTTGPDYALHNASGLQLKPSGGVPCGVLWRFPSRFRQGRGQATVNKLTAWAIVKVVSASSSLQLSFGLGGFQFESPEKLVGTGPNGAADWALLIVDDVSPYADYVTFNLSAAGGGVPPSGNNEYVLVDSFGVCANGIDYRNLFGVDNM